MSGPAQLAEQRDAARALANETRLYRAALKRGIKERTVDITEVLRNPHPFVRKMLVADLLMALPRVAGLTAHRLLSESGTAPSKTVIALTHRQVEEICRLIERPHRVERSAA